MSFLRACTQERLLCVNAPADSALCACVPPWWPCRQLPPSPPCPWQGPTPKQQWRSHMDDCQTCTSLNLYGAVRRPTDEPVAMEMEAAHHPRVSGQGEGRPRCVGPPVPHLGACRAHAVTSHDVHMFTYVHVCTCRPAILYVHASIFLVCMYNSCT